jgi:hypothetical protein
LADLTVLSYKTSRVLAQPDSDPIKMKGIRDMAKFRMSSEFLIDSKLLHTSIKMNAGNIVAISR